MITPKELIKLLNAKRYDFDFHEHSALFTVEDSNKLRGEIKGLHSKNLFLKNKRYWRHAGAKQMDSTGHGSPRAFSTLAHSIQHAICPVSPCTIVAVLNMQLDKIKLSMDFRQQRKIHDSRR